MTPGDSQPCRCSPICTTSSALNSAKPTSVRCGGKIVHCNVRAARATTLDSGAHTNIAQDANVTGAIAASAPSTISPLPCCIGASDHCRTGSLPPFCCVSPVRPGALPDEVGIHIRTSYRWCWWLRNAALSYEIERQLEGTVEA